MTNSIHFTKMHGAGNDYIYVNTLLYSIPDPAAASIAWSNRHTGIGSDGLVLIGAPTDASKADYSMRIFNADGSEAMMCGNASRCIGKYLYDKGICQKEEIRLETLSGIKTLALHLENKNGTDTVASVTVDMLEPQFNVPAQYTGEVLTLDVPGARKALFVSMGNPHYVIFVDDVEGLDISIYGPRLEHDAAFPERCNIEFAEVKADGSIRTRVWERGSGITMACGTGACATAAAAAQLGLSGREADIAMDGGTLHINWAETDGHIYMTGPAAFICEGEIALP
jgi:diaminopimelate epimerase